MIITNADKVILSALEEDLGLGDITSDNIAPASKKASAIITAKEDTVICGLPVFARVFEIIDADVKVEFFCKDGDKLKKGGRVLKISGPAVSILRGERTALNFLQRLSGIAVISAKYAEIAKKYGVRVCDTRKSLPGFRYLDKYAVRCGGAHNHRMSLSDAAMIKDNHIKVAGSIKKAVSAVRAKIPHTSKIEVETKTIAEVKEALSAGVDIIMLDNMKPADIKKAIAVVNGKAIIEVSGGINLENFETYARLKPDVISIGALTHSVKSADLSLNIQ